MYVCGDNRGARTSTILEVDLERDLPLIMDNGELLPRDQCVQRLKFIHKGQMKAIEYPPFQRIDSYELKYSITKDFLARRQTGRSKALATTMNNMKRKSFEGAKKHGMPQDLFHGVKDKDVDAGSGSDGDDSSEKSESDSDDNTAGSDINDDDTINTVTLQQCTDTKNTTNATTGGQKDGEDTGSLTTKDINYHAIVTHGNNQRGALEDVARNGQRKQAEDVNKARTKKGGEVLPKWMICTIRMPSERNDFTPKNLPVMICGFYKKKNYIRYKVCTENGILQGTYGREQLTPYPEYTPQSMRIDDKKLDKNNLITLTQAGEMYSKLGGRLSYCRCKTDCSVSKRCKCRLMNKFCTQHCHGGNGGNRSCRNCPPPQMVADAVNDTS
jgi:hypothetical protein